MKFSAIVTLAVAAVSGAFAEKQSVAEIRELLARQLVRWISL